MAKNPSKALQVDRRNFLVGTGAGIAAGIAGGSTAEAEMHGHTAPDTRAASTSNALPAGYVFFNDAERSFVEAVVDTLIPADAVGPGALELGVATYIDRQMAGSFGKGARLYLQGPFLEGTPQQGWQLAMTPSELMRAGIADSEAFVMNKRHVTFSSLPPQDRAAVLHTIETGDVQFSTVPATTFFEQFLSLVYEGYFGDPIYGGNRGKASWKMIGFPGVAGMYADDIVTYRNKPYPVVPKSIQDLS